MLAPTRLKLPHTVPKSCIPTAWGKVVLTPLVIHFVGCLTQPASLPNNHSRTPFLEPSQPATARSFPHTHKGVRPVWHSPDSTYTMIVQEWDLSPCVFTQTSARRFVTPLQSKQCLTRSCWMPISIHAFRGVPQATHLSSCRRHHRERYLLHVYIHASAHPGNLTSSAF